MAKKLEKIFCDAIVNSAKGKIFKKYVDRKAEENARQSKRNATQLLCLEMEKFFRRVENP
jgi:hypothetical protein